MFRVIVYCNAKVNFFFNLKELLISGPYERLDDLIEGSYPRQYLRTQSLNLSKIMSPTMVAKKFLLQAPIRQRSINFPSFTKKTNSKPPSTLAREMLLRVWLLPAVTTHDSPSSNSDLFRLAQQQLHTLSPNVLQTFVACMHLNKNYSPLLESSVCLKVFILAY